MQQTPDHGEESRGEAKVGRPALVAEETGRDDRPRLAHLQGRLQHLNQGRQHSQADAQLARTDFAQEDPGRHQVCGLQGIL